MDPMASITETDYFSRPGHVGTGSASGPEGFRLLRRMARRRRLLIAQMRRELADPRCLADFGIDEGGDVYNKTAAAMARALGGR